MERFKKLFYVCLFWKVNQPWIYLPRFWIGEVYWEKVPEKKLPACRISGINDNLISAYLKIILFPLSILLKHPFGIRDSDYLCSS